MFRDLHCPDLFGHANSPPENTALSNSLLILTCEQRNTKHSSTFCSHEIRWLCVWWWTRGLFVNHTSVTSTILILLLQICVCVSPETWRNWGDFLEFYFCFFVFSRGHMHTHTCALVDFQHCIPLLSGSNWRLRSANISSREKFTIISNLRW